MKDVIIWPYNLNLGLFMSRRIICNFFILASFIIFIGTAYSSNDNGIGSLGYIEPRSRVIKISHNAGPEGARVKQLLFLESDLVKSGEKLALLADHDKRIAQAEVAEARVKVLKEQQNIERITVIANQKEHLRYQSLKQSSMASISLADAKRLAFEQTKANIKRLSAEIMHAESELKVAKVELKNTAIYAPITGTILKVLTWPGERIQDNGLLEMADLSQLDVIAEVYESDLSRVKVGQKAYINAIGFKRVYNAQVRELGFQVKKNDLNDTDPLADRDNRIIEVRLTLEPQAVTDLQHQIFRQVHVRIEP